MRSFPAISALLSNAFWGLALCLLIPHARASDHSASNHSIDVFLGYSRMGANDFYPNVGGLNGWDGAMHVKFERFAGIEGDVSRFGYGANATIPRTTSVMAGPRLTLGVLGVKVFAHALAGVEHSANSSGLPISGTALDVAAGGGADFKILPFFSWRLAADYLAAPTQETSSATHARFSTGIVFHF